MYPANIGMVGHRLEVREGMVWQWGQGGAYSGVPAQTLWGGWGGECPIEMTYHPKEGKMSWNH